MSASFPDTDNLLRTVRDFLDDLRSSLEGEQRYHAQVASYLLDIVLRERSGEQVPVAPAGLDARTFRDAVRSGTLDGRDDTLIAELLDMSARDAAAVRPSHVQPEHREDLK